MKIAIIGYSGSGKSTLAQILGEHYNIEVLHLDTVHHLPGWGVRDRSESQKIVAEFLMAHSDWVIDGTYSKLSFEERMESSDRIVVLRFNRFRCLYRVIKRYFQYKNSTRPDMAPGCKEKVDAEFAWWVLYKGRGKAQRERFCQIESQYAEKVIVIKNQKQLNAFINSIKSVQNQP
jgi:adenylate kinase family enzyme